MRGREEEDGGDCRENIRVSGFDLANIEGLDGKTWVSDAFRTIITSAEESVGD